MSMWLNAVAASFVVFALPFTAVAQLAPDQLDIIGLKLGMTVQQAKDILEKYNSRMRVVTTYTVDGSSGSYPTRLATGDQLFRSGKVRTPVGLEAALLTHTFDSQGHEIIDQQHKKILGFSGEWFSLAFTPTDDGGRLYSVSRTVHYPTPGETAEELKQKLTDKYGKPANVEGTGLLDMYWVYDIRGRLLPQNNKEYVRCLSQLAREMYSISFAYKNQGYSWDDYIDAYNEDGKLQMFTPDLPPYQNHDTARKQCGVELEAAIDSHQNNESRVTSFTLVLSDQNASYFDNGLESYWLKKSPHAPKIEAPKL